MGMSGAGCWAGILVLAILGALGMLGYVITVPREKGVTEFYLLDLNGKAVDYPGQLMVGEEGKVMVDIINREYKTITSRLEVRIGGAISNELSSIILDNDEKWEETVGFTPDKAGDKQKVEFLLYRQGQSEAYQKLYLWLNVQ